MKYKIINALILGGLLIGFVGSVFHRREPQDFKNGETLGRFIVLEKEGTYEDAFSVTHHQYLVYDKDTYIIYTYDIMGQTSQYEGSFSITPFYCMNENNEPEIAVYWDGMEE